ncbi:MULTISPECIES: DUF6630 family protein [Dyella]|uniref:DUF6630 domain-containing protein n=2 Tax=Dyella TaxID=231454 RepID=A0A4R0Z1J8_9GAMM|nr:MULTISPECIES: hypothetical protein [Dyella]TBR39366.1 hypothetical protein EYV96_03845 [Dyella terrae]TCI13046.1 hypothetical protein EZM97_07020 [Dyella soli]
MYDDDFDSTPDFDDDDDSMESRVWQLFVLINPGDDESALQQFAAFREAVDGLPDDEIDVGQLVVQVADWRSAFHADGEDTRALVQVVDELASRWSIDIDWDGDPDEDEFHADIDTSDLIGVAYDNLAPHGYTLWVRDTEDDSVAGWMALSRDTETMRELATELGIHVRRGNELG